jgi:hypothetical protein
MSGARGCRLGRIEYDGAQYCYEHFGFAYRGGPPWCDEAPAAKSAASFQPRRERPVVLDG